jgi:hypothetical protein
VSAISELLFNLLTGASVGDDPKVLPSLSSEIPGSKLKVFVERK